MLSSWFATVVENIERRALHDLNPGKFAGTIPDPQQPEQRINGGIVQTEKAAHAAHTPLGGEPAKQPDSVPIFFKNEEIPFCLVRWQTNVNAGQRQPVVP